MVLIVADDVPTRMHRSTQRLVTYNGHVFSEGLGEGGGGEGESDDEHLIGLALGEDSWACCCS